MLEYSTFSCLYFSVGSDKSTTILFVYLTSLILAYFMKTPNTLSDSPEFTSLIIINPVMLLSRSYCEFTNRSLINKNGVTTILITELGV